MQTIWNNYRTPIIASGVGLGLVLILAVVPLFDSSKAEKQMVAEQKAQIASAVQEVSAGSAAEIEALRQELAAQSRVISDLQNRIKNLDRGVTKTFWRSKENTQQIEAVAGANQRLSNLEAQMDTINVAVPRLSARIRKALEQTSN